jgi:small-conductance mechanosensitive channel
MELAFVDRLFAVQMLTTIGIVLFMLLLRFGLTRMILARVDSGVLSEAQRRRVSHVRFATLVVIIVGPVLIWAPELQNFALSLTAVAVAVVIATKELLLCLSGALLRAGTRAFAIGDWVEIGAIKGEVIETGLMATTLQEIDVDHNVYEYTGRTLVVPNSVLLTSHVRNENFMKRYVFHQFAIYIEPGLDPFALEALILDRIRRESAGFYDVARRYNSTIRRRTGVEITGPEPRVLVSTTDVAKTRIAVSLFCPTRAAAGIQQAVTREVMNAVYDGSPISQSGSGRATIRAKDACEPLALEPRA